MQYNLYKPNSKNTGCAFSFKIATNTKFPVFYVNAIMQHGWDDKKKTGSFLKNKDDKQWSINILKDLAEKNKGTPIGDAYKSKIRKFYKN